MGSNSFVSHHDLFSDQLLATVVEEYEKLGGDPENIWKYLSDNLEELAKRIAELIPVGNIRERLLLPLMYDINYERPVLDFVEDQSNVECDYALMQERFPVSRSGLHAVAVEMLNFKGFTNHKDLPSRFEMDGLAKPCLHDGFMILKCRPRILSEFSILIYCEPWVDDRGRSHLPCFSERYGGKIEIFSCSISDIETLWNQHVIFPGIRAFSQRY